MSNFDFNLKPGKELIKRQPFMPHQAIISVITPAWNPTEGIFQLANCILNQTYPYFEWLIIDDGSTNQESLERLDKLSKMDGRIRVIHKKNEGASKTRDYGASQTSKDTKYIVFIDDDDLLDPTFLECAYFSMNTHPEASWCYSDVVNFEGEEVLWNKYFSSERMKLENLLVSQAMITKEAFHEVGGFALEGHGLYEDWIFWLKLLAKKRVPIHMSYYGFWYRRKQTSGQLSLAKKKQKENMDMVRTYSEKIKEIVPAIQYPKEDYNWDGMTESIDSIIVPKYQKDGKINILMIIPWMTLGGADKYNLDLIELIDKEKYRITIVSTQPAEYIWRQKYEELGIEIFDLSTFLDRKDWTLFVDYLIESRKMDLLFVTNSVTGYMMLPYLRAKYPTLPIMDYIHMEEWYNRNGGYSRDSASVSSVIDRTLFCNQNSERILADHFGIEPSKIGTVYIGVDADRFNPKKYDRDALRKKYQIEENRFVVSLIARIDYQKRPYLLMEIIKSTVRSGEIPNILFVIAGDGPLLGEIKAITRKYHLEKFITFLGKTDTPDEIYAVSDMTLNCSIKEGLALTAYESLSMGVPVVSCDVGGQKELINEKTGVIVPCIQSETEIYNFNYEPIEIQNYVDGIEKVFKQNERYKKACRKRILDGFTIQNMVINMEKEFDQLVKQKKKNDLDLLKHIDVTKELINQYFLGNQRQYQWLCREYRLKLYGYDREEDTSGKQKFKFQLFQIAGKLKLTEEVEILFYIFYEVARHLKHFIEAIIMIPVLIIKLIYRMMRQFYRRCKRIIKRKVGQKHESI